MSTRPCRTCRQPFAATGRGVYCSPACRCGTDAGYQAGCKCDGCKAAHARTVKRLLVLGGRKLVPVIGTRRRLEALACLGWSRQELSTRMGHDRSYLGMLLRNQHIEPANAAAVARLYDELSMTWCTSRTAGRVAADARSRGYAPPLAWDDHDLDDPDARAYGSGQRAARAAADYDQVVVDRILAGEYRLPSTRSERTEVATRWAASGRSLAELGRLTGWKPERYYRISDREVSA